MRILAWICTIFLATVAFIVLGLVVIVVVDQPCGVDPWSLRWAFSIIVVSVLGAGLIAALIAGRTVTYGRVWSSERLAPGATVRIG